ncbi:MAG: hypothetical protein KAI79_15745 [Bacteroidales bacterium]|nr:hypothetical protein [Bacteroidales bacterium]
MPYKHYRTDVINDAIILVLLLEQITSYKYAKDMGPAYQTISNWIKDFQSNLTILSTEGMKYLGRPPPYTMQEAKEVLSYYQDYYNAKTKSIFGDINILHYIQVKLTQKYPPIGIFRPLLTNIKN